MRVKDKPMRHIGSLFRKLLFAINVLFAGALLLTAYSPYIHPATHPIASCLGLTFPFFLGINLFFLVCWLFLHYKYTWLSLLALLLCHGATRTYAPMNFRTVVPEGSLKILSYNTMAFGALEKKNGKNPILTYIQQLDADIVCLQEYASLPQSKTHLNEKDISKELKRYRYHSVLPIGKRGDNRIACFSKYPILSARTIDYESDHNGSVIYELKVDEDTITLINNHLESNKLTKEDKVVYESIIQDPNTEKVRSGARMLIRKLAEASRIRSNQVDAIAREVAASRHRYILVCGDFNDSPISYTHRIVAQDLVDAFVSSGRGLGISYNQNQFYFRIDNILTSKNINTYNCTIDRSITSSDHYPIWCHFQLQKSD